MRQPNNWACVVCSEPGEWLKWGKGARCARQKRLFKFSSPNCFSQVFDFVVVVVDLCRNYRRFTIRDKSNPRGTVRRAIKIFLLSLSLLFTSTGIVPVTSHPMWNSSRRHSSKNVWTVADEFFWVFCCLVATSRKQLESVSCALRRSPPLRRWCNAICWLGRFSLPLARVNWILLMNLMDVKTCFFQPITRATFVTVCNVFVRWFTHRGRFILSTCNSNFIKLRLHWAQFEDFWA